ncbi:hypothetical protein JG688_00013986, partial [Phytophthora aleatoria]
TCNIQGASGSSHLAAPGAEPSSTARRRSPRFPSRRGVPGGVSASAPVVAKQCPPLSEPTSHLGLPPQYAPCPFRLLRPSLLLYLLTASLASWPSTLLTVVASRLYSRPSHTSHRVTSPTRSSLLRLLIVRTLSTAGRWIQSKIVALVCHQLYQLSAAFMSLAGQVDRHNIGARRGVIASTHSLPTTFVQHETFRAGLVHVHSILLRK